MPSIRISQENYDELKAMMHGRSWDQLLHDLRTGASGAPGQIHTNNNVPPKPPTPPVPDPLTMTFGSISDAVKVVKKLNRKVGWQQYFINNDPFDNVISIKRHPTLEEKAKAAIEAEELRKISYQKYLERTGKLSQPDCASH